MRRPPRPVKKERPPKKERPEGEKSGGGGKGILIAIIAILLLGVGGYFVYTGMNKKKKVVEAPVEEPKPVIKPTPKLIDISEYEMLSLDKGNYLYALSKQLYGDPKYWPLIYKANYTKLDNPDFVTPLIQLMVYEMDSAATVMTSEDSLMMSEAYQSVAMAYMKHNKEAQSASYAERAKEFVPAE